MYIEALFSYTHESTTNFIGGGSQISRTVFRFTTPIKVDSIEDLKVEATSAVRDICKNLTDNEEIVFTVSGIVLSTPFVFTKVFANESEIDFSDLIELDPYR